MSNRSKSKEQIFKELVEVVGVENASMETEVLFSYARDGMSPIMGDFVPDYVVRPGCLEEAQQVVRIAAENTIPLQPISMGTNFGGLVLATGGGIQVDMRGMNRIIEINEVSMAATIEPGVTWGELNREAKKRGLYLDVPFGPYTGTPVGGWCGWNLSGYFSSAPPDKVLSLEVVLPSGEILRTASLAYPPHEKINPYFREAYGPDLTGLFRGSFGAFGIVTKMTVGLHPLFETQARIDIDFEDLDPAVKAMQAVARRNIQTFLALYNNYMMAVTCAPDFYKFVSDKEELMRVFRLFPRYLMSLGLNGSAKQVALYKEMIGDIVAKNGGSIFDPTKLEQQVQENMDDFLPGAGRRVNRFLGPFNTHASITLWGVGFDKVVSATKEACRIIEEMGYRSEMTGESEPTMIICPWALHGRTAYIELDLSYNPEDPGHIQKVLGINQKTMEIMRDKYGASMNIYYPGYCGPLMPEYIKLLKAIKKYFDQDGIMAPGKLIAGD